jgi:hypothetical protein
MPDSGGLLRSYSNDLIHKGLKAMGQGIRWLTGNCSRAHGDIGESPCMAKNVTGPLPVDRPREHSHVESRLANSKKMTVPMVCVFALGERGQAERSERTCMTRTGPKAAELSLGLESSLEVSESSAVNGSVHESPISL